MKNDKEGTMVRIQKTFGLFFLTLTIVACQSVIPTEMSPISQKKVESKVALTFSPVTESDEPIILTSGSQVQVYKDDKLIHESLLGEDNLLQIGHLNEPPPYRYVVSKAKIKEISFNRLLPVGTQGGLVTAPTTDALLAPGTITTLPDQTPQASNQLQVGQEITFEGKIEQDLRKDQTLSLETVVVKKKKN